MAHPGKVVTGHKLTTWDIKWENYVGFMVVVSVIPLYYVICCDMPVGWMAANEHYHLNIKQYRFDQIGKPTKWPFTLRSRRVAYMEKSGQGLKQPIHRSMADKPLKTYVQIVRVSLKSISVFHG